MVISTNVQLRLDGLPYSNQRSPTDPGVSVWFTLPKDKQRRVLACDKWDLVEHNMRAIARHIEALRGQERWGVGSLEQAFRGYAALPASTDDWRDVLEMRDDDGERTHQFTAEEVTDAFRRLALTYHPDVGGSHEAFLRLTAARDRAMKEINGMSHTVS